MSTRIFIVLLLTLGAAAAVADEDELKDFTSDGCSSFPDGTREHKDLWHRCCVVHDIDYWKGGSAAAREASDQALKECVADVGEPGIAKLMLAGVRAGGSPWWPTKYRWGYGWPWLRGYKELTPDEQERVAEKLAAAKSYLAEEGITLPPMEEEQATEK